MMGDHWFDKYCVTLRDAAYATSNPDLQEWFILTAHNLEAGTPVYCLDEILWFAEAQLHPRSA
jgi:hypothetical protein